MKASQWMLLLILAALLAAFFGFDLQRFLTLEAIQSQQETIASYRTDRPLASAVLYALLYIAVTALSLPGAAVMTLAGGAIFGLVTGGVIVSFASSIGATLAFLASRFLFRDAVRERLGAKLRPIDEGIRRDGAYYLFTLRLVPLFPFFMINLAMGLTSIRTWTFYWVSQLGMLAGTVVYVNAGTQLAKIDSLADILSPPLLASFALLGLFPLAAKKSVEFMQRLKVYRGWRKPKRFDANMVVIGAGAGGLVAAYVAAAVKAKVVLVEKAEMGGDCLNRGCVPSKALIRTGRWLSGLRRHKEFGIDAAHAEVDFSAVMDRVRDVVSAVAPHDSVERYQSLGVDVIIGEAKITSPWQVEITTRGGTTKLATRAIVIAAGARPFVPPIAGLHRVDYLTSDTVWDLKTLPKRLLVLGGGPIGCELAQCFARLGSRVTQVEMLPRIMAREDLEVSEAVTQRFAQEGIEVLTGHKALEFVLDNGKNALLAEYEGEMVRIGFDRVLIAIGRAANLDGYGLEELGIRLSTRRTIDTNPFQQTNFPNIYAVGDVAGPYQFTHAAAHQAWHASVNALFGTFWKFRADAAFIPWATFTDPEVARAGLNEQEAKAQGIAYETATYGIDDLDRAIADGEAHGFVKVLTPPGKDRILGVTIVGEHAGELIAEFVLAMKHGLGLNKILGTIHVYPTMAEANKYVAGTWKKAHAPEGLLRWLARYHEWMRR